jgi:hypothetical protein
MIHQTERYQNYEMRIFRVTNCPWCRKTHARLEAHWSAGRNQMFWARCPVATASGQSLWFDSDYDWVEDITSTDPQEAKPIQPKPAA